MDPYHYLKLIQFSKHRSCYTSSLDPISLSKPGIPRPLPDYVIKQLRDHFPNMRKYETFVGGHPISITRSSLNEIFSSINNHRQSPYLVCQKSDGVRYLLIVAKVIKKDLLRKPEYQEHLYTQCYFVGRKGHRTLQSFVVDVGVSLDMDIPTSETKESFAQYIVQILDGELVVQKTNEREVFRYLMFDGLVHLGRNICDYPLKQRLNNVTRFVHCNQMLAMPPHVISVQLKDFFRLTNRRFNVMGFMSQKYFKMMEHGYDGLIFNHEEKKYVVGSANNGYIKWKPEELNTVDFVAIPNSNFEQKYGKKVIDLYVGAHHPSLHRYVRAFYAFAAVDEETYCKLEETLRQKQEQKFKALEQTKLLSVTNTIDEFSYSVVVQCRYQKLQTSERQIMNQLTKESALDLKNNMMKQTEEEGDLQALQAVKKKIYDKNWKISKIRQDKSLPNNIETVKKIEDSIRDAISLEELIKKGSELNAKIFR